MNRTLVRTLFAGFGLAICLWPIAVGAQATQSLTVDQVRDPFVARGFNVGPAQNWTWTSPPVTTLQIFDQANGRVLMALVYPDTAAAHTGRALAQADVSIGVTSDGYGPPLVPGYGQSLWRGNVALVQTSQSELERLYRWQTDRDNGVPLDTIVAHEPSPPNFTVDLDFQQALENSAVSL